MKMDLDLLDYNDSLYYTTINPKESGAVNQFLDDSGIPYFIVKLSIGFMYIIPHGFICKFPQAKEISLEPSIRWDYGRYIPIEWSRAFLFSIGIDLKQLFRDWKIDLKDPSFHG